MRNDSLIKEELVKQLVKIKEVLQARSHGLRFYGSSVLLVYCADSLVRAREAQNASLLQLNCKLIDF